MPNYLCKTLILSLLFLLLTSTSFSAPLVPDPQKHSAFLYNDWYANRPSVVLFIDPLCPYCKKVIPDLNNITDYNLFVFWAPIFGARSENIIAPTFKCDNPSSPSLLNSLLIKGPGSLASRCSADLNSKLRGINDEIVTSYKINGVPSFFLQGVKTSVAKLKSNNNANIVNGVSIDWRRYKQSKLLPSAISKNLAIIFSNNSKQKFYQKIIEEYRPEYLLGAASRNVICDKLIKLSCVNKHVAKDEFQHRDELLLLLGLEMDSADAFVVTKDGKLNPIYL